MIRRTKMVKEDGNVTMSLEVYNAMAKELEAYRNVFDLVERGNTLYVNMDIKPIMKMIKEEVKAHYPEFTEEDYWLNEVSSKSIYSKPEKEGEE